LKEQNKKGVIFIFYLFLMKVYFQFINLLKKQEGGRGMMKGRKEQIENGRLLTIYVPSMMVTTLKKLAQQKNVTISEYVRQALLEKFKKDLGK